jgi:hypothetical protein
LKQLKDLYPQLPNQDDTFQIIVRSNAFLKANRLLNQYLQLLDNIYQPGQPHNDMDIIVLFNDIDSIISFMYSNAEILQRQNISLLLGRCQLCRSPQLNYCIECEKLIKYKREVIIMNMYSNKLLKDKHNELSKRLENYIPNTILLVKNAEINRIRQERINNLIKIRNILKARVKEAQEITRRSKMKNEHFIRTIENLNKKLKKTNMS